MPEIDHLVGVFGRDEIAARVRRPAASAARPRSSADSSGRRRSARMRRPAPGCGSRRAFRVSENLRRLRPDLHVLRDSQDARQARHQADRRWSSPRPANSPPTACRELIIVAQDTTYYGLDLYGEVAARRTAAATGRGRRHRLDSADVPLSDVLHRRADRHDRRVAADHSRTSTCRCSTSTSQVLKRMQRRVNRDEDRSSWSRSSASGFRISCCGRRSSPASPAKPTTQFEELLEFVARHAVRADGRLHVFAGAGHAGAKLDGHLPEDVKERPPRRT